MQLFRTSRLIIKKNFPQAYAILRAVALPLHFKIRDNKVTRFTTRTTVQVAHAGISFSLVVDPANGFVDTEIFTSGVYEPDILSVIKEQLSPGGVYVDIGANIGQHALFAATHTGTTGKVIAFEPIPRLVSQIQESIAANALTNVTVHQIACSNTTETVTLKMRPGNIGGSGFHHDDADFEAVEVCTQPADEILANEKKIDFIKIDTEGHELEVLLGMTDTLKRHKPTLLIEYSPSFWIKDREQKSAHFFKILNTCGYTCYDLEAGHTAITNTTAWYKSFNKTQTNFLCIASSK